MADKLTDTELDSLEKLLSGTCPAPWRATKEPYYTTYHCAVVDANDWTVVTDEAGDGSDTEAIAALRNAAPALLAEIRDLRQQVKCLENAIGWEAKDAAERA